MARKNGIDLFRLIGAFFIMILHASLGDLNETLEENLRLLARWAVPFYFMASGYFLEPKISGNLFSFTKIQNNVSRLVTILITSSLLYSPFAVLNGDKLNDIEILATGTYFHLWFIGSLIFGLFFLWYIYFIKKVFLLPLVSIIILILATFVNSYDLLIGLDFDHQFFRFLLSIPFLFLGYYIAKMEFTKINKYVLCLIALSGFILQHFEVKYISGFLLDGSKSFQFLIGTILAVIPLFILSTRISMKANLLSSWGREHSLFIYLYHPMAYIVLFSLVKRIFPENYSISLVFFPIIGFVITLFAGISMSKFFPKLYSLINGKLDFIKIKKGGEK